MGWSQTPAAAETPAAESRESLPSPQPPQAFAEEQEEPPGATTPEPDYSGDLFAETAEFEPLQPISAIEAGEPDTASSVVESPPEPEAPVVDKTHWRSLLNELGLEAPPEPEPEATPAPDQ